jgi:mono/diheme cytochrome c family protein
MPSAVEVALMLKAVFVVLALMPFLLASEQTAGPTVIPAEAAKMVNPVKPTPESQAHVKKMWGYDCAICHGATGNGKGDIAAEMKPPLKDYTDPAALKDMTDGEIFYIIKNGKGQMPPEGDRAKPEDIWNMVILVRSFAKK